MKQMTLLATTGFEKLARSTRKAAFLAEMERADAVGRDVCADRAFEMLAMINRVKWGRPLTGEVRPTCAGGRVIPCCYGTSEAHCR